MLLADAEEAGTTSDGLRVRFRPALVTRDGFSFPLPRFQFRVARDWHVPIVSPKKKPMQQQNDNKNKLFASALKKARGRASQKEFADWLHLPSQQTYGNYERGRIPKTLILKKISQRIGVTIEELLRAEVPENVIDREHFVANGVPMEIATHLAAGAVAAAKRMPDDELAEEIADQIKQFREAKPYMKATHAELVVVLALELKARHSSPTPKLMTGNGSGKKTDRRLTPKAKRARLRDIAQVSLSIYGSLPAGWPEQSHCTMEEQAIRVVRVPRGRWPEGAFGLDVRGDSMNAARPDAILDGDTVILVSPEEREPQSGDIVAALIDGETCLKRLVNGDRPAYLKSESTNPTYGALRPVRELVIQGVVIGKL